MDIENTVRAVKIECNTESLKWCSFLDAIFAYLDPRDLKTLCGLRAVNHVFKTKVDCYIGKKMIASAREMLKFHPAYRLYVAYLNTHASWFHMNDMMVKCRVCLLPRKYDEVFACNNIFDSDESCRPAIHYACLEHKETCPTHGMSVCIDTFCYMKCDDCDKQTYTGCCDVDYDDETCYAQCGDCRLNVRYARITNENKW